MNVYISYNDIKIGGLCKHKVNPFGPFAPLILMYLLLEYYIYSLKPISRAASSLLLLTSSSPSNTEYKGETS